MMADTAAVYIDLLSLTGTVSTHGSNMSNVKINVRLLLSSSPPFVRTGTFSFTELPEFDISAKPLKSTGLGSFDAVRIPGVKSFSKLCQVKDLTYSAIIHHVRCRGIRSPGIV